MIQLHGASELRRNLYKIANFSWNMYKGNPHHAPTNQNKTGGDTDSTKKKWPWLNQSLF